MRPKERFLKLPEVIRRTGMGKTFIYTHMANGAFPKQVRIKGSSSVRWRESEIDRWMEGEWHDTAP